MVNGEADQDSIENAEESMSPRQRRNWVEFIQKHFTYRPKYMGLKQFGEADELSED